MLCGRTSEAFAIRAQQFEAGDVAAECTGPVVVLAVYVIGNGTANRYKLGTR